MVQPIGKGLAILKEAKIDPDNVSSAVSENTFKCSMQQHQKID
jgi:hypothetical protein